METLAFIWDNLGSIARMTLEHIEIVGGGVSFAILTFVPLGIAIYHQRARRESGVVHCVDHHDDSFGAAIQHHDSMRSIIGQGIGFLPTVIALFLCSQLPIVRNTYTAITNID